MLFKDLDKAFAAGVLIGIAALANLSTPLKPMGAFLFSFGLVGIVLLELRLYTGMIGYVGQRFSWPFLLQTLIFNLLGVAVFLFMPWFNIFPNAIEAADAIVKNRLAASLPTLLFSSFVVGILMLLAVEVYKRHPQIEGVIFVMLCVMVFVNSGLSHGIADSVYYIISLHYLPLRAFISLFGNTLGSICIYWLVRKKEPAAS
jgi:formate/nitrite transporter FocA (FNT family)